VQGGQAVCKCKSEWEGSTGAGAGVGVAERSSGVSIADKPSGHWQQLSKQAKCGIATKDHKTRANGDATSENTEKKDGHNSARLSGVRLLLGEGLGKHLAAGVVPR